MQGIGGISLVAVEVQYHPIQNAIESLVNYKQRWLEPLKLPKQLQKLHTGKYMPSTTNLLPNGKLPPQWPKWKKALKERD